LSPITIPKGRIAHMPSNPHPLEDQPERGQGHAAEVERLAALAAAGDSGALDRLLALIQPGVLRVCGRFLFDREDAEEACQDTLLAVGRHISSYQGRSRFSTWLWPVTANAARDACRRLKRHSSAGGATEIELIAEPRRTSVIAGNRLDLLNALEAIDERYARAVVMRDLCGLSYSEVADELRIPVGTVRSRIHEGRRLLRQLLGA